jgi:HemY protein
MRKILILILLALLLGAGLVALIEASPSYMLLSYGHYTLETSLWVGLAGLLLIAGLLYLLLRLPAKLFGRRNSVAGWVGGRRAEAASRLTSRGLIDFAEGNLGKSRRELLRGARSSAVPLINYLLAARASAQLGEPEKTHQYLGAALESEAEAETAVDITRAELQLEAGQYAPAAATLARARAGAARHPRVLELLRRAYQGAGDWQALAKLLPELRKHGALPEGELQALERQAFTALLQQGGERRDGESLERLQHCWQQMPAGLKQDPALIRVCAGLLLELGAHDAAGKLLVRALKHAWDPALVRLYGYVQGSDLPGQLAFAESLLPAHPGNAELLLCVGRHAARNALWGKARDYFEACYRVGGGAESCAELGRLLEALGEPKFAAAYFREGLLQRESGLPELPLPDGSVSRAGGV